MRETKFSILKAIAIICVVLSHAGISGWLFNFVFIFHVPIFFICAGYFFNTKYLTDERTYIVHRFKGLYLPFVRWSLFFLLIHNVLFPLGILSETYGNAGGGVTHPYTWQQFSQHAWSIVSNMSGYDQFLCGAFWFFRALLLASIGFLLMFKLLNHSAQLRDYKHTAWGVLFITLLLITWKTTTHLNLTGVAQGGYRELMGMAFMTAGFLLKQYEVCDKLNWKTALTSGTILLLASCFFPSSMVWNPNFTQFISLPLPAIAAFVMFTYISAWIDRHPGLIKRTFAYIGEHTLYIFAFHLVAFKVVSALKVWFYDLPWEAVGGHPVVITPANNWIWVILYLAAGVILPLLWLKSYRKFAPKIDLNQTLVIHYVIFGSKFLLRYLVIGLHLLFVILKNLFKALKKGIKDILAASSTKDE